MHEKNERTNKRAGGKHWILFWPYVWNVTKQQREEVSVSTFRKAIPNKQTDKRKREIETKSAAENKMHHFKKKDGAVRMAGKDRMKEDELQRWMSLEGGQTLVRLSSDRTETWVLDKDFLLRELERDRIACRLLVLTVVVII